MSSTEQTSDVELLVWNYIRNQYEGIKDTQDVPMELKIIILEFSRRIIGCKILSIKQDMEFFHILSSKLPSIHGFRLLYRASDNEYSHKKFHELCDDQGPTICIIKSNWNNIFGGYTSKSWRRPETTSNWVTDKNAFLFLIKSNDESIQSECPMIIKMKRKTGRYAICCKSDHGPLFGSGHEICIRGDCNAKVDRKRKDYNYSYPLNKSSYECDVTDNISGSPIQTLSMSKSYLFQVIDYEVFNVQ